MTATDQDLPLDAISILVPNIDPEMIRLAEGGPEGEFTLTFAINVLRLVFGRHKGGPLELVDRKAVSYVIILCSRVLQDGIPKQRGEG